jgi:hypothetical protein
MSALADGVLNGDPAPPHSVVLKKEQKKPVRHAAWLV